MYVTAATLTKALRSFIALTLVTFCLQTFASTKPSPEYVNLMSQWAEVTNFGQNASEAAVEKITENLQKSAKYQKLITPELTSDLKQFFYELFASKKMMANLATAYSEYYTLDELLALIQFYKTPLGQKMIKSNEPLSEKIQHLGSQLLKENENQYMLIVGKHITNEKKH